MSMNNGLGNDEVTGSHPLELKMAKYTQLFQTKIDQTAPFVLKRWASTGVLLIMFMLRVILAHGWYLVAYALGIYLLNLFLAFLQPKFDPSIQMDNINDPDDEDEGLSLPMKKDEEFRPFIRRLPEFKFWKWSTRAVLISIACTVTRATDVPVFWPILLMYFLILFTLTMRRQIEHMIKYKYVPFDLGKSKK